jgi:hypothetical protein
MRADRRRPWRLGAYAPPPEDASERKEPASSDTRETLPSGACTIAGCVPPRPSAETRIALARGVGGGGVGGRVAVVGQQHDVAAIETRLLQQRDRALDRAIGAMAVDGHDVGREAVEEQRDVRGILGEGRDGVRVVGEGDEPDLAAVAFAQERGDLRARLQQARRREVRGRGGARQVDRDDERRAALPRRLRDLPPRRPREREERKGGRRATR